MFRMMTKGLASENLTLNTVEPAQATNEPPKTKSWLQRGKTMQQRPTQNGLFYRNSPLGPSGPNTAIL